jgi:hypothetical protein
MSIGGVGRVTGLGRAGPPPALLSDVSINATEASRSAAIEAYTRTDVSGMADYLRYNLTVQAGRSRDMVFPGGATFKNGILMRVTTAYAPGSLVGPGDDAVFINGSYLKENIQ